MAGNILIVDDEQAIADLVEVYLKNENYNIFKFITAGMPLTVLKMKNWTSPFWMLCSPI